MHNESHAISEHATFSPFYVILSYTMMATIRLSGGLYLTLDVEI